MCASKTFVSSNTLFLDFLREFERAEPGCKIIAFTRHVLIRLLNSIWMSVLILLIVFHTKLAVMEQQTKDLVQSHQEQGGNPDGEIMISRVSKISGGPTGLEGP